MKTISDEAWNLNERLRTSYEAAAPGTLRSARLLRAWSRSLARVVRRSRP
jgi:hypothetical protein